MMRTNKIEIMTDVKNAPFIAPGKAALVIVVFIVQFTFQVIERKPKS
jgi:hypothetical protein